MLGWDFRKRRLVVLPRRQLYQLRRSKPSCPPDKVVVWHCLQRSSGALESLRQVPCQMNINILWHGSCQRMNVPLQGVLWVCECLRLSPQVPIQRMPAGTLCRVFCQGTSGAHPGRPVRRLPAGVLRKVLRECRWPKVLARKGPCNTVYRH